MVKQTIQIFARVKPTVRKQQQGVRVGAARAPARRGLSGRGRGGTRGSPARVRGSAPGADAARRPAHSVLALEQPTDANTLLSGGADRQALSPFPSDADLRAPINLHGTTYLCTPGHTCSRSCRPVHAHVHLRVCAIIG